MCAGAKKRDSVSGKVQLDIVADLAAGTALSYGETNALRDVHDVLRSAFTSAKYQSMLKPCGGTQRA